MDLRLGVSNIAKLCRETAVAVDLISKIPQIQHEYEEFQSEVAVLEHMASTIQNDPSRTTHPLMKSVLDQLVKVTSGLQEIKEKCSNDSKSKINSSARRLKWLLEENKIQKLLEKAREVKQSLGVVLGLEQSDLIRRRFEEQRRFQIHETQLIQQQLNQIQSLIVQNMSLPEPRKIEELPDDADLGNNYLPNKSEELVIQRSSSRLLGTQLARKGNFMLWADVIPMTLSGCSEKCQCHCHFNQTTSLAEYVVKTLTTYKNKIACDPGCEGGVARSTELRYQPLKWFGINWLQVRLGPSLRPQRIIPENDDLWFVMRKPSDEMQEFLKNRFNYYPNEVDLDGGVIVEYALLKQAWDFLEVVLQVLWRNLLPSHGLPRNVAILANRILEHGSTTLNDRQIYLLQLAKSHVANADELRRTQLYEAVERGDGIEEALLRQPWAIDKLDYTGFGPMHEATINGDIATMKTLINAGADVNIKDWRGWTPLMQAVGRDGCVQCLLDAKCNVNLQARDGKTALHIAVERGSPEETDALLKNGASVTLRTSRGETPVYEIVTSTNSQDVLNKKLVLLLAGKADLEVQDRVEQTPLLTAIISDKLPAIRCLSEAGASFYAVDDTSQNILHYAAVASSLETLEYLNDMKLVGIDTELRDESGDCPLDLFLYVDSTPSWSIGTCRKPSSDEKKAFEQLYLGVRNRNIQNSINRLKETNNALAKMDKAAALKAIDPLIKQMDEWNRDQLLHTLWYIQERIDECDWPQASDAINETIWSLVVKLHLSPWEGYQPRYTYSDSATEEDGYDEEYESEPVYGDEQTNMLLQSLDLA